jgi:uncharacterized protein YidB (DUF937 family)
MGLLDQVIGAAAGIGNQSGGNNALLELVLKLLSNPQTGGLSGLVQAFQNAGLGEIVNSWLSTGENLPVSAEQISRALGSDQIAHIAGQLGISDAQASGGLAELLPQLVDRLTPNGEVPAGGDLLSQGVDLLKGRIFG